MSKSIPNLSSQTSPSSQSLQSLNVEEITKTSKRRYPKRQRNKQLQETLQNTNETYHIPIAGKSAYENDCGILPSE